MLRWFKMKKQEIQFKLLFYSYANVMIFRKSDIVHIGLGLLESCKGKSPDKIYEDITMKIAERVGEVNTKNTFADKDVEIDDLKAQIEALSTALDKYTEEQK